MRLPIALATLSIGMSFAHASTKVVPTAGCLDCFNFVAPSVLGAESVSPAEIGLIVYDSSYGMMRAYNQSGRWMKLSNERVAQSLSATGTILSTADFITANSSSGAMTLTLPSATTNPGKEILIKKTSADVNWVTVVAPSSQTIDGSTSFALVTKNATLELVSDGSNYIVKYVKDPWRVDASITGGDFNLGGASVASYTGMALDGLSLVNNALVSGIPASITCAGTTVASGTTCGAAVESIGVSFNLPAASEISVCASFTQYMDIKNTTMLDAFEINETPNNSDATISQEGGTRIGGGLGTVAASNIEAVHYMPHRICGNFSMTTPGQRTIRLMYVQSPSSGTLYYNQILGNSGGSATKRDIHWEITPIR